MKGVRFLATSPRAAGSKSQRTASWRDVEPAPLVLLSGPEEYLAGRASDRIAAALRAQTPDLEVTRLDAAAYTAGELLMAASPSLFGDAKLILAGSLAQMNDDFLSDALAYVAGTADDVVLVLHHGGGTRGKKLLDAVRAAGAVTVDCQPLKKDSDKQDFVSQEFRSARRRIEPEAVRALVAAVGSNLAELASACSQLLSDTSGEITADLVEKYYGGRVEATAFKVADAALAGRGSLALSSLRHALATGVDPVPLVAALAMKMRQVAKVAGRRKSAAALAKELGMAPWQAQQAMEQAQYWSEEDLSRCIQAVADADAQVKGASRDPVYALERAVTEIALAARR